MPTVLWWGRYDPQYSRNRIVCKLFSDLGWQVTTFRPWASSSGWLEAYGRGLQRPDLLWVPCFRQRDVGSALFWRDKWGVPLIVDPLISAYQKDVFEKGKWPADSRRAERRRLWEADLLGRADLVVADTPAHADYYGDILGVRPERLAVVYVGAEDSLFVPWTYPPLQEPYEILFYGSYLRLQGIDVIVRAAERIQTSNLKWVLLGDGDLKPVIQRQAQGLKNVVFEPWLAYADLPGRMARAHIILGIFGTSRKAGMVIPNKMFQTMALGRPVITRKSSAYPSELLQKDVIGWVPEGDPQALADRVRTWLATPEHLAQRGQQTRDLFERYFSANRLRNMLGNLLHQKLGLPRDAAAAAPLEKEN
jgi:glycosyltransferase involved in cell wall biosynthesis